MFLGQHEHTIDDKGRVILPVEFRPDFGDGGVLTKLLDGCLALWTPTEFDRVAEDLMEKARRGPTERAVARSFSAGAKQFELDKQGRIVVPPHLREFGGLKKEVVITGSINRVEVWDKVRWKAVDQAGEDALRAAQSDISDLGL